MKVVLSIFMREESCQLMGSHHWVLVRIKTVQSYAETAGLVATKAKLGISVLADPAVPNMAIRISERQNQ